MDTIAPINIRDRLKDLNTKAYYLFVALSFVYRTKPTLSLKLAITLTAVAVFPVQDFIKSTRVLEGMRRAKVVFPIAAFLWTFWWVWFATPAAAQTPTPAQTTVQQKPAPPQPTEQQKLDRRVSALEARLKEANAKADRAAMEKDYIERIQKKMNAHYEKALDSQLATVTIIALVLGLIGKFRVNRIVQSKLTEARAQLESKFNKKLAAELKTLKDSNAGQMKHLQRAIEKRIDDLRTDLTLISDWLFQFLQGMIDAQDERRCTHAISSLRRAVQYYKSGKPRAVLERFAGETSILNLFATLWRHSENESDRDARTRQELKSKLYDGLEDELRKVALEMEWLRPLVAEREAAPPALQPPASATASPIAQESPRGRPTSVKPRKPQERNDG